MSYLTKKTIEELQRYKFFIPSYQRGYRWGELPQHQHPSRKINNLLDNFFADSVNN